MIRLPFVSRSRAEAAEADFIMREAELLDRFSCAMQEKSALLFEKLDNERALAGHIWDLEQRLAKFERKRAPRTVHQDRRVGENER